VPQLITEPDGQVEEGAQSGAQSSQILHALAKSPLSMLEIVQVLNLKSKTGALKRSVNELLSNKFIEYTLADKPNSRLQKYRVTENGRRLVVKRI